MAGRPALEYLLLQQNEVPHKSPNWSLSDEGMDGSPLGQPRRPLNAGKNKSLLFC